MKPLIPYYGGKQYLSSWIISHLPRHITYVEPFCGGAAIFFAKELAEVNVLNDINENVINLYKQSQNNADELFRLIDTIPHSRREYTIAQDIYKGKLSATDIERACATYVSIIQGFANKIACGYGFNKPSGIDSPTALSTYKWRIKKNNFFMPIDKIQKSIIENIDALYCIEKYDTKDTLFYIDPPYINTNQGSYSGYAQEDFDKLIKIISNIKGIFFLSHYYNEEISNLASKNNWNMYTKNTVSMVSGGRNGKDNKNKRMEVLVTNYHQKDMFS